MVNGSDFQHLYGPKDGYVFLVTYGRSGSTLMSNYLNSFPGYCIRGENNNVLHHLCSAVRSLENVNFTFRREDKAKPFSKRRVEMQRIMETPKDPWYGAELVNPSRFAKTVFDNFVKEILAPPPGTRVAGFKEIRWANYLGMLNNHLDMVAQYFPNTKFIFQTRDAESVSKSGWWKERPAEDVRRFVKNSDNAFLSYLKTSDASMLVRYEDIVQGDDALRKVAEFLGEDFCSQTAHNIINEKLTHLQKKG